MGRGTAAPGHLKTGDQMPPHIVRPIVNAPVHQLNVGTYDAKLLVLNFWGTWCSPCIPEMDALARLQERNKGTVQVVGVSDESPQRLLAYLRKKPSGLWLASDTGGYLYGQFGLSFVGQCVIVDRHHRIVAVTLTDSVNQSLLDSALKGLPITSYGNTGLTLADEHKDLFESDSGSLFRVLLTPYRSGSTSMGKTYPHTSLERRRLSWINVDPLMLYMDAYDIHTPTQVIYEGRAKALGANYKDTTELYCMDLLVQPSQTDSLRVILRRTLNELLPVKARMDRKMLDVYVLTTQGGDSLRIHPSDSAQASFGFSGRGFDGTGIRMKVFMDYLCNELGRPVIDETGLKGVYDIHTENVLRTAEEELLVLDKLGLRAVKATREVEVLVLSDGPLR